MKYFAGILAVALSLFSAGSVLAATVYAYQGYAMTADDPSGALAQGLPVSLTPYSGTMVIDEAALPGGSLIDATITFSIGYLGHPDQTAGLISFDVFPFPAVAGSSITFQTDSEGRIVSWLGDFLDGPPDGRISSLSGDTHFVPGAPNILYSSGVAGQWSVVSAPFSLVSMVTGLIGLGIVGRVSKNGRRRRFW